MPGRSRTLILNLAVIGGVSGGIAAPAAAQEATPAVIHACYVPLTGTVYRIKETGLRTSCSSTSHVEFSWTDGEGALRATDAASGDLSGTLGAPTVARLQGHAISAASPAAGHVLTFDGTQWLSAAAPSGGLGADGSFLATGAYGTGTIPATGAGVRMMWYPGRAAFRVGRVNGTEWDDAKIGAYSIATGIGTTARASYSTAMGFSTTASGVAAIASGYLTTASGAFSTAMGGYTTASNSVATAMGYSTTASGYAATAMGNETIASGGSSTAMGSFASTNGHAGAFVYGDVSVASPADAVSATAPNQFVVRAQHMWFGTNNSVTATSGRFLETSTGAYLSSGGVWTNVSDVNRKHLFEDVSGDDILKRLAGLPITEWSYKTEDDSVRHLGPTAQDFYSAFHLGSSDTSIGTVDADGVSLLAIQALEKRTRELQSENTQLRSRLDALEAAMRAMRHTEESQP